MTILKGPNYRLGLTFMGFKGSGNLVAKGHKVDDFVLIDRIVSCTLLLTIQVSSCDAFACSVIHRHVKQGSVPKTFLRETKFTLWYVLPKTSLCQITHTSLKI